MGQDSKKLGNVISIDQDQLKGPRGYRIYLNVRLIAERQAETEQQAG